MQFTLFGTDSATGNAREVVIDAQSAAAAREIAHQRGMTLKEGASAGGAPAAPAALDYEAPGLIEPFPLRNRRIVVRALLGAETVLLLALLAWVYGNSGPGDRDVIVNSLLVVLGFLLLQMGILVPVVRPRPAGGPGKSPWYWLSAIALGLVVGLLVVAAIFFAADYYWATHEAFTNDQRDYAVQIALYLSLACWLISIPLIMAFMKRRRPESFLARLSAMLFMGSVVELVAGIPILDLARRRDSCTCSLASFWAIFLAILTGTIVLGPMIFLLILARRTRAASRGFCAACGLDLRPHLQRDPCPRCGAGWKSLI